MEEIIKKTGNEVVGRWQQKMPRFFRQLVVLCACVAVTAYVVNTVMTVGGATPHEWWTDIYPLLLGVPAGMIVVCKLTVAGGYKDIDPDALSAGHLEHAQRNDRRGRYGRDGEHYDNSDVEAQSAGK